MVPKRVPESARGCVEVEVALLVLLLVAQDVHGDAGHLGSRNLAARIKFLRDFQLFFPSKETYFSFVQLYFLGKGQKKFSRCSFWRKKKKKESFPSKKIVRYVVCAVHLHNSASTIPNL